MAGGEIDQGDDGLSLDIGREIGFDIGVRYLVDLQGFTLRTGLQLAQYNGSSDIDNYLGTHIRIEADYSALQFKIPVTAMYRINQNFGFFGGLGISLNLDDEIKATGGQVVLNLVSTRLFTRQKN